MILEIWVILDLELTTLKAHYQKVDGPYQDEIRMEAILMFLVQVLTTHLEESMSQLERVLAKSSEEETAKVKYLVLVNTLLLLATQKMQRQDTGLELLREVDR